MRYLRYLFILLLPLGLLGCGGSSGNGNGGAPASYVPPGEKDDYYLFYSGGHSGQVFAAGLPSARFKPSRSSRRHPATGTASVRSRKR
jgi:nitrous-oxide reductase